MTCTCYIEKSHNLVDGYEGSCTHSKSPDKFCPYYGNNSRCEYDDIDSILDLSVNEAIASHSYDSSYYKSILMILSRDIDTYTDIELARILAGLALKVDTNSAIITVQKHQTKLHKGEI